jgi:hypothetical protein
MEGEKCPTNRYRKISCKKKFIRKKNKSNLGEDESDFAHVSCSKMPWKFVFGRINA